MDPRVHGLQGGQLRLDDLVLGHDHEVDVAVDVGIADRERALQVRTAEALGKDRPRARDQLPQNGVKLGVDRRVGHPDPST